MSDVAVIATGGKQYLVRVGDKLAVEKLPHAADETVRFADVLHADQQVAATILGSLRDPKVRIVKFKSKVRYLRRQGHRQEKTQIRIDSIG